MPPSRRAHSAVPVLAIALLIALLGAAQLLPASASGASIGQLSSQLAQQHSQQQSLSGRISSISQLIGSLSGQISLVRGREAAVSGDLAHDRAQLAATRGQLAHARAELAVLEARLAHARLVLSNQLRSNYESDSPDVVTVVLEAHGFTDLLDKLKFLQDAETQQQSVISATRSAKADVDHATARLTGLEQSQVQITNATATRVRALAGMNALMQSKQSAMQKARTAQQTALAASRERGAQLQSAISRLQAQQAAAQAASQSSSGGGGGSGSGSSGANGSGSGSSGASGSGSGLSGAGGSGSGLSGASGPALGPSGGWAIPYPIVECESGGQNLPPNSAGASGYYQILPATWRTYGGTGPAAYLASKAEQDAVASRIWAGSGPSAWVCAGIVGIK